jgi:hypothetical protein
MEKFFFWRKDYDAHDHTPPLWLRFICESLHQFRNAIHPRIEYVKIDPYDVWSMDHTLALIVLPMLRELKRQKHGSPYTDDNDVPEHLRSTNATKEEEYDVDSNHHARWEWILDEMIFAFETKLDDDWEDQFKTGEAEYIHVESDRLFEGEKTYTMEQGPNHTLETDWDGIQQYELRMRNGFRLFGTYYSALWD